MNAPAESHRYARRHTEGAKEDQRLSGQRDRDRILYTSAFQRLAGVTQVVGPLEGYVFHNRLTHTLEVAQIARRLAEKLTVDYGDLIEGLGGLDPDVVEAAAMAHDLGHPHLGISPRRSWTGWPGNTGPTTASRATPNPSGFSYVSPPIATATRD